MINNRMRLYDYYTFEGTNNYNQPKISEEVKGQVKMAIYPLTKNIQDNALYLNAEYVGITHEANVDDTYIIVKGKERLKVLYTYDDAARFRLVYMSRVI